MNDAELRCRREYLGITMETLAQLLHVPITTMRAWEHGEQPVPYTIPPKLDNLETLTDTYIDDLKALSHPIGYVTTFRGNPEMAAHVPSFASLGASWHRRCAETVSRDLGIPVRYPSNPVRIAL